MSLTATGLKYVFSIKKDLSNKIFLQVSCILKTVFSGETSFFFQFKKIIWRFPLTDTLNRLKYQNALNPTRINRFKVNNKNIKLISRMCSD